MKKSSKTAIALAALLVAVCAAFLAWRAFSPAAQEGAKTVSVTVINDKGESKSYTAHTDAEFLRGVMDDCEGLEFSGTESEYGLMVETVNGIRADYAADAAYWAFYSDLNGNGTADGDEYCAYGIDSQPVADGESYIIVYEKAA